MILPEPKDYPKYIQVGVETYRIRFCKVIYKNPLYVGMTESDPRVIKIKLGLSPYETFLTFIHEVLHAFEYEYDISIKHSDVYLLEKIIGQFLFQNF